MVRIGIVGAAGRMGRAIASVIEESDGAALAGGAGHGDDVAALARACDVLVDFSAAAALEANLAAAADAQVPIVVGTTGLDAHQEALVEAAAARVAVLRSANMSLGVNLLAHLVREAAARLGDDWDVEILEMHHRYKVDAPSGTALLLGRAAAEGRGVDFETVSERVRDGIGAPRARGRIGFAALRGGSVAGDHQVILAAEGERLELGHRAESRAVFARGAVRAALWLADRPAGLYSMTDVLGL